VTGASSRSQNRIAAFAAWEIASPTTCYPTLSIYRGFKQRHIIRINSTHARDQSRSGDCRLQR
jgi:hypothetical protein